MMRKITGITKAEQDFNEQVSRVRSVRYALADYHRLTGTFPSTITNLKDEVQKALDACKAKKETTCYTSSYSELKQNSTTDNITNTPFIYSRTGTDDFSLVYQIHLDSSIDSYSAKQYVEGKNTSTKEKVSVEGKYDAYDMDYLEPTPITPISSVNSTSNKNISVPSPAIVTVCTDDSNPTSTGDYDLDGLSDLDEVRSYGTDPCVADSDRDSYSDPVEVQGGYNPNGAGVASSLMKSAWPLPSPTKSGKSSSYIKILSYTAEATPGMVTVTWVTDAAGDDVVNYGISDTYGGLTTGSAYTTSHKQVFYTTTKGLTLHYAIRSCVSAQSADVGCVSSPVYTIVAK
jgi:hypothetical protein